jgi:hypothetical protein
MSGRTGITDTPNHDPHRADHVQAEWKALIQELTRRSASAVAPAAGARG